MSSEVNPARMVTDEEAMLAGLVVLHDERTGYMLDKQLALELSDYYEEQGVQYKAECLRWMEKYSKRPMPFSSYTWFFKDIWGADPMSDIPKVFKQFMKQNYRDIESANYEDYDSWLEAIEALIEAWPNAIQEGWEPQ